MVSSSVENPCQSYYSSENNINIVRGWKPLNAPGMYDNYTGSVFIVC